MIAALAANWKLALGFGLMKGMAMSVVLAALNVAFWEQVIIVIVGATITSAGAVVASIIAARAVERNRVEIEHVKRAIGADRRAEDGEQQ